MIVYEVNLRVDLHIAEEFRAWLDRHVQEILQLPGFVGAQVYQCETAPDAEPGERLCVHYRLRDRDALQEYFDQHAAGLRQAGIDRFGNRFSASRRVLRPLI